MQYFALLISKEDDLTPDQRGSVMAAFESFHAKAAPAIQANSRGQALAYDGAWVNSHSPTGR